VVWKKELDPEGEEEREKEKGEISGIEARMDRR
jgi:hypothetical protein